MVRLLTVKECRMRFFVTIMFYCFCQRKNKGNVFFDYFDLSTFLRGLHFHCSVVLYVWFHNLGLVAFISTVFKKMFSPGRCPIASFFSAMETVNTLHLFCFALFLHDFFSKLYPFFTKTCRFIELYRFRIICLSMQVDCSKSQLFRLVLDLFQ